jgi:hypothetical protein
MANVLRELDDLLRGRSTQPELLAQGTAHMRLGSYVGLAIALGVVYGLSAGLFAVLSRVPPAYGQLLSSALKVPALFLLTLVVVFPSLYVFMALLDVRLSALSTLRLVMAAIVVTLTVLASFASVTAFFTVTAASYPFMKLLNVFLFGMAGLVGLGWLSRALARWEEAHRPAEEPREAEAQAPLSRPYANRRPAAAPGQRGLFFLWMLLYAFVGVQMAWLLRPLIGAPAQPFTVFSPRTGNAFADFFQALNQLLGTP